MPFSTTTMAKEYTIEELEREHTYPDNGHVPRVPFGFEHAAWLKFKANVQPGDKIVAFESSADSWEHLAGRAGYVLVRGDEVVDQMITIIN